MFRPIRSSLIAALLLTATSTSAQLNGTYTIGTAGNYATFTAAVTALTTSGVSGPVVFDVFSGTYNEQLNIGAIAGASAANTILFRSQGLDNTLVTLDHPSQATNTNDYLLQLNGCDHITFQHITLQRSGALDYARIVNVLTGSTDWHFLNDRFISSTSTSTTGLREMIAIAGPAIGASSVEDCTMTNGMGPYLSFVSSGSFTMSRNSLTNVLRGLNLNSWSNGTFLMEDNVITTRTTGATRGALFDFCSGNITVRRNTFTGASNLFSGLLFNTTSGTVGTPIKVEGNVIIGTTTALNGISAMSGICSYIDVSNNSVSMSGAGGQAMVVVVGSGTGIRIRNNIFRSAGYTLRVDPASRVSASDNNVFRSLAGNSVQWGPSWYATIAALNAATGMNGNSLMTEPQFVDPLADLHLQGTSPCLGAGQVIAGMGADLDGDARPLPALSNPEIGADETTAQCAALSGTYIIGPSVAADHPTFNSAANAMISCGIAGPVLFLVESGTYTEQISLPPIAGNSATNTITFRGQALDSAAVVLEWPTGATAADNWAVRMTGADYVRLEHLTLQRTGTDLFGDVVSYAGTDGSRDLRITRCHLNTTTNGLQQPRIISAQTTFADDSLVVLNTRFQGGSFAVFASTTGATDHVRIEDCVADEQNLEAFRLDIAGGGLIIVGNTITTSAPVFGGIVIGARTSGFRVEQNRIDALGALAIGIRTTAGITATTASRGRIRNNMVHAGLTAFATFGTQRWMEVDHNTFYGSVRGVAFAFSTFQNFFFRNNIIASEGHTVQFLSSTATSLTATFNLLHRTTAGPLAYWNADRNTLANLQTASGNFANSLVADPLFYVPLSDLHVYAMEADAAGTPIAAVTTDIDGDVRSLATPDIGADEFQPMLWNEAFNTCGAADAITSTGSGNAQWIYKDRKVVARFNDNGQNLGTVSMSVYVNSAAVRQSLIGQHYLDRNWHLQTQNAIVGVVSVRLFHSGNEFTTYATADPVVSVYADAGVAHYVGPMEDCNLPNNPAGNIWTPIFPASPAMEPRIQGNAGTHGYTAALGNDGELYITTMGLPLPVELLSFTGERTSDREVMLHWTTATEHNNAGFEVWRMIEGEDEFTEVGWVDGAGDSQQLIHYQLPDENTATQTSYYQLKQVDNDGQFTWTPVVVVGGASTKAELAAYPNPARDHLTLLGLPFDSHRIVLFDATGRLVRAWNNTHILNDLGELERGVYTVGVESGAGMKSVRVVLD